MRNPYRTKAILNSIVALFIIPAYSVGAYYLTDYIEYLLNDTFISLLIYPAVGFVVIFSLLLIYGMIREVISSWKVAMYIENN